ncbi:nicotinate/nicotinamide nucleotide adenylyltransferase [Leptolyngbyaceae cyanobacterium JSC-12]|nr:nicotinate/nicotinamide nucleotide adenylyltransferase [Leptolyngbyaceae cyanobacterium JSC-12]
MSSYHLKKVGILGGTFDPIHVGHLLMAETALEQFNLDQIIWVPAYQSPHKTKELVAFNHRWEMLKRAIADHPDFIASDVDQKRGGISYAIATLTDLQHLYPNVDWYWIIGIDAFQSLPDWRSSVEIASQATWLVAPRNQKPSQTIGATVASVLACRAVQLRWYLLKMPQIEISSSLIRQYCQEGRSLRYLVPDPVRVYIATQNLYKK